MAYLALLWKANTIENYRRKYEREKINSIRLSNSQIEKKTLFQRFKEYNFEIKDRSSRIFQKIYPGDFNNLLIYLKTDQTFPNFLLKSVIGFIGGIVLTYLCFMFFVFQLSISLINATIMSSIIGVLLTLGLAFSYRIRCLVFLLLPQFFSRVGRYTLTCYALVLILTGPATNTMKNSEVLSESMACGQEQIKLSVQQMNECTKKPFNAMKDSIQMMVQRLKLVALRVKLILKKINIVIVSVVDVLLSSFKWLNSVAKNCNERLETPYKHCKNALTSSVKDCEVIFGKKYSWLCNVHYVGNIACSNLDETKKICVALEFADEGMVGSVTEKLQKFADRVRSMLYFRVHVHHSYSFSSNTSGSASQVAAGIVTEIRNKADPLLTWLSWSSCVTSLFLVLIIFRAKYYQHMFETRSRFDNRYVTKELRDLDLQRMREGRETILPLNRREKAKYIKTSSFRLLVSEKTHLSRSAVFMVITTFKLMIHMVADYSLFWVLTNIRFHGRFQVPFMPTAPEMGAFITGKGPVATLLNSLLTSLTLSLNMPSLTFSPITCLPDPFPPDLRRYKQIGMLIFLIWFLALFEPYGLRLRHVIMELYRPERSKSRAEWLFNHIQHSRSSFMRYARRKLHREYKYYSEEAHTFRHCLNKFLPWNWLRYLMRTEQREPKCVFCEIKYNNKDPDTFIIRCKSPGCPGAYCTSCFSDIGKLCTICLSPADYGDLSDVSMEKGSDSDTDDETKPKSPEKDNRPDKTVVYMSENADIEISEEETKGKKNRRGRFSLSGRKEKLPENIPLIKRIEVFIAHVDTNCSISFHRKANFIRHNRKSKPESIVEDVNNKITDKIGFYPLLCIFPNKKPRQSCKENDGTVNNNSNHELTSKVVDKNKRKRRKIKFHMRSEVDNNLLSNVLKYLRDMRCRSIGIRSKRYAHRSRIRYTKIPARQLVFQRRKKKIEMKNRRYRNVVPSKSQKSISAKFARIFKSSSKCIQNIQTGIVSSKPVVSLSKEKSTNLPMNDTHLQNTNTDNFPGNLLKDTENIKRHGNKSSRSNNTYSINKELNSGKPQAGINDKEKNNETRSDLVNENETECCHCMSKVYQVYNVWKVFTLRLAPKTNFCNCFCKNNITDKAKRTNHKRRKKDIKDNNEPVNNQAKKDSDDSWNYRISAYLSDQDWNKINYSNDSRRYLNFEDRLPVKSRPTIPLKSPDRLQKIDENCVLEKAKFELNPSQNAKARPNQRDHNTTPSPKLRNKDTNTSTKDDFKSVRKLPSSASTIPYTPEEKSTKQTVFNSGGTINTSYNVSRALKYYNSLGHHDFESDEEDKFIEDLFSQDGKERSKDCPHFKQNTTKITFDHQPENEDVCKLNQSTAKTPDHTNEQVKSEEVQVNPRHKTLKRSTPFIKKILKTHKSTSVTFKNDTALNKPKKDVSVTFDEDTIERQKKEKAEVDIQRKTTIMVRSCAIQHKVPSNDVSTYCKSKSRPTKKVPVKDATTDHFNCLILKQNFIDTGTIHENCLKKLQNSGVQCQRLQPSDCVHSKDHGTMKKSTKLETKSSYSSLTNINSYTSDDSTKTDTTVYSISAVKYEDSPRKKVPRLRIDVATKANRSTGTDGTAVCDASTLTSDWWSPILERKAKRVVLTKKREEHTLKDELDKSKKQQMSLKPCKRIQVNENIGDHRWVEKKMKTRGSITEERVVKFHSRAQIIPPGPYLDIMSPSRYLLESQKYYNELFHPKLARYMYSSNANAKQNRKRLDVIREPSFTRRGTRPKRLEQSYSPRKLNVYTEHFNNQRLHSKPIKKRQGHRHRDRVDGLENKINEKKIMTPRQFISDDTSIVCHASFCSTASL